MANYLRKNAWNNGGTFGNSDLLWYAKGVGKMMTRALDDQKSWWFYAAIHGEYVSPEFDHPGDYPGWAFITAPPKVPITPLPVQNIRDVFWNQCQHQTWYFLPWHRGYLLALEAQLRADIISMGGPNDWALPYWDYLGGVGGIQYALPPSFAAQSLPDGSPNPLFVAMRYGPDGDGNIYVPTAASEAVHPGDPNFIRGEVNYDPLQNDVFTGSDSVTKLPGFGGPDTPFWHGGGTSGNLEANPHNIVHVYVGGAIGGLKVDKTTGLMADPGIAALDPIFYLHHANIDRLWEAWNASGNSNPTDTNWRNRPAQSFIMPTLGGQPWIYTPAQMDRLSLVNYTYDDMPAIHVAPHALLAQRLSFLGVPDAAAQVQIGRVATTPPSETELLGASEGSIRIQGVRSRASVRLDVAVRRKTEASLESASAVALPDNVYLKVENIRGTFDACVLGVFVNLPDNITPREGQRFFAGQMALFGLRRASMENGQHSGAGLTFVLDITHIVDELHRERVLDVNSLSVILIPSRELPDGVSFTVGRISVYRQGYGAVGR